MIHIENLTARQVGICDILWKLSDEQDVTAFIKSLPTDLRQEAETLKQMIQLAVLDDMAGTGSFDEAREVLQQF